MRDGSCLWRAAAVAALLLGLAQTRVDAQQYYGQPPVPSKDEPQGQYTSASYNAMLMEMEARLAALEDKEKPAEEDACKVVDIQKKPSHKFRGRMFFDQLWMDDLSGAVNQPLDNQTGFDTLRLGVTGNIYENLHYSAEFEFEGGEVDYKSIYGELQNLPLLGNFRVGHFKEPFSLEELTSSRYVTFMERSAPTVAFAPTRNLGIQFYNYFGDRENWSWYLGYFRGQSSDNDPDVDSDNNDWALTGRIAGLPYYDEATPGRCLLHVGAAVSLRRIGYEADSDATSGSGDWEGFLELDSKDSLINVTLADGTEFNVFGTEIAYMRGPFSIQNEVFWASTSSTSINNWGTYVQASYFLTGENRGYKKGGKAFDRVKPYEPFFWVRTADGTAAGWGAWELAARWSYLDLEDLAAFNAGATTGATVVGTQENIALGVNWYLNPYSRMMLNYVHSITDYTFIGKSEGDHLGVRFQIDW